MTSRSRTRHGSEICRVGARSACRGEARRGWIFSSQDATVALSALLAPVVMYNPGLRTTSLKTYKSDSRTTDLG